MIIRISGLPGSGKTTLGELLSSELDYRLFRIDHYRQKHRDEFKALIDLFQDIMVTGDDFILDSTGFNKRIDWVFMFIRTRIVDIKLVADIEVLKERIRNKEIPKDEYFPYDIGPREQFVEDFFDDMAHMRADIVIDTSRLTPTAMFRCAIGDLKFYDREAK